MKTNAAAGGHSNWGAIFRCIASVLARCASRVPGIWGDPKDPAAARRLLRKVVDLGVTFIDTADSYGPEVSERLIAEALHPYPKGLVIATKGGLTRSGPEQWHPWGARNISASASN